MAIVTVQSVLASAIAAEIEVVSSISVEAINVVVERVLVQTAVAAGYATATVSRTVPEAVVDYVLAFATPYLDEEGWYKKFRDEVTVTDLAAVHISKGASDQVGTSDEATLDVSKGLSDSVGVTDNLVVTIIYIRNLADTATVSEQITAINTVKGLADSVAATESLVKDFSKALSEQVSIADAAALLMSKPLADSVVPSDSSFWSIVKALSEAVDASDALDNIVFDKVLSDSVSTTDAKAIDLDKPLSDSVSVADLFNRTVVFDRTFTDTATTSEFVTYSFEKYLQDSATPSDAASLHLTKVASDTVTATDAITSIVIVSGATQLVNSFPLNVFTLNGP